MHKKTKRIVAVGAPLAIVAGVGVAFAAWTANGSGSGGASAATAHTITLTASTGAGDLYPGGYGQVNFTESNSNAYAVTFDTVSSVVKGAVTPTGTNTCTADDFTVPSTAVALATADKIHAAAGDSAVAKSIPATEHLVQLSHDAADGCQGASIVLTLTLTGSQD